MRIGFVGIGTMGALIAEYLIGAGHRLTVYDLRPAAMAKLGALGAAIADSPMEAAYAAEAVFTSLPGPSEVESAALDPERGIFASLRRGGTYIDLTTNAPATIRRIADSAHKRDIRFLDAPVSGRPPNMTVMVGGREADFAQSRPLFEAIAANVFHVGPSGAGCAAKLVTQYLGYTGFIAALEGMLMAAKAGIDLDMLVAHRSGQRRRQPHLRQHPARRPHPQLRRRRHARHRRQGHGPRGGAFPRGRRAGGARRARPRRLQARPGAGLGRRGLSGGRPGPRSDGGGGTQIGRITGQPRCPVFAAAARLDSRLSRP